MYNNLIKVFITFFPLHFFFKTETLQFLVGRFQLSIFYRGEHHNFSTSIYLLLYYTRNNFFFGTILFAFFTFYSNIWLNMHFGMFTFFEHVASIVFSFSILNYFQYKK